MSKYIKFSEFETADDLLLKSQKIDIGGKKFKTPIKSLDISKARPDIRVIDDVKGLNEIYKIFDEKILEEFIKGLRDERNINLELERKTARANEINPGGAIICFVGFEGSKFPDEKGIDFLMNLAHEYSDAPSLPLIPRLFPNDSREFSDKLKDYKNFMKKCIDSLNRSNKKSILGVIPETIPSTYVADLVDFYYKNDITSFVYDFQGKISLAMRTKIREMMIAIKDLDLFEKTFLYSINANNGKMIREAPVVKARDILTFGFGFDTLGDQHIRRVLPPDVAKMLREKMAGSSPLIRLFNNKDYGYYKTSDLSILEAIYPKSETFIPFNNFKVYDSKAKSSQALFNNERIGLEAIKYQKLISEEADKTSNYFKTKKHVGEKEIKDLEKFRDDIGL